MKNKCVFAIAVVMFIVTIRCYSQAENFTFIASEHLTVTCNKTTNLVFPYSVQSIDRGSRDILVQQPKGTENIVQLKADKPNFSQTNLSVITVDGKLYSFTVDYAAQPSQLNIVLQNKSTPLNDSLFKQMIQLSSANNKALFDEIAEKILATKAKDVKRDKANQIELQLNGLYINHDVLFFRFTLKNKSNISYEIDAVNFTIKDRQKSKRTATQETEIAPFYVSGSFERVAAHSIACGIIALPKFTLPDAKYLFIGVLEKHGGRDLHLVLINRQIMDADPVKEN